MTATLQAQSAESGRMEIAWATSFPVMPLTRRISARSSESLPSCLSLPTSCTYAWAEEAMAVSSETSISWRRPVGLVAQAAISRQIRTSASGRLRVRVMAIKTGSALEAATLAKVLPGFNQPLATLASRISSARVNIPTSSG